MRSYKFIILPALIIAVLLLGPASLYAARRVVNEVSIEEIDGCAVIMAHFNFPVRYRRHFPKEPADELRIQFEPISMGPADLEARFEREDVRFSSDDIVPLSEVIFEGNVTGGPFLTLTFESNIAFEVAQGTDFRSLVITPFQDTERTECFPID